MPEAIVVDCSVAAKWVLAEPGREAARKLLERSAKREISLIAPDLILVEFASLISKHYRRKLISSVDAEASFDLFTRIAPALVETSPLLNSALALSLEYGASLWDCVYIALAVEHKCACLTADGRLFRSGIGRHSTLRLLE
jgi:predicted nucleic acid-binding protein